MRKIALFGVAIIVTSTFFGCAKYIDKQVQGMAEGDTINHKEKQKMLDMNHTYPKSFVTDLVVKQEPDNKISVHYQELAESAYGSQGADYVTDGETLKIKILRCHVDDKCSAMVDSKVDGSNGKNGFRSTFSIPYHGERIVFIYDGFEEQVTLSK